MSAFTLDTSGAVEMRLTKGGDRDMDVEWPDLSPFEQGYTRAALEELQRQRWAQYRASCASSPGYHLPVPHDPAYSWLAPETLAAIRKDCEQAAKDFPHPDLGHTGEWFWRLRQADTWPHWKPLTPYLSDDGKVRLREGASA